MMLLIKVGGGVSWAAKLFAEITDKKNRDKEKGEGKRFRLSFLGVIGIQPII